MAFAMAVYGSLPSMATWMIVYLLAGLIPQAWLKIYLDSVHGFLFQHHAEFAADVTEFLGS
jgi:hypothetical protein